MVGEDRLPVECHPRPILGLHLVGDQHVRVQVRVTGAGVEVRELGGVEPTGCDLFDASCTASGACNVVLDPPQRVGDSVVVAAGDRVGGVLVGQRPQHTDGLGGGEGEVVAGDCLAHLVLLLVDPRGDVGAGCVRVSGGFLVELPADLLRHLGAVGVGGAATMKVLEALLGVAQRVQYGDVVGVDRKLPADQIVTLVGVGGDHLVSVRVDALAVECGHLCLVDDTAGDDGLGVEAGQSTANPASGGSALGLVVAGQGVGLGRCVVGRNRAQQVLVASTRVHRPQTHHEA